MTLGHVTLKVTWPKVEFCHWLFRVNISVHTSMRFDERSATAFKLLPYISLNKSYLRKTKRKIYFFIFFQNFTSGLKGVSLASSYHGEPASFCPVALTQLGAERLGVFGFASGKRAPKWRRLILKKAKNRQTIQYGSLSMIRRVRWTHFRSQIQPNFLLKITS